MARRAAIARAAALGSPLALLDEPFTGLDEENRRRAADFLLGHFPGAAMAVVVHHPEEAELLGARPLPLESLRGLSLSAFPRPTAFPTNKRPDSALAESGRFFSFFRPGQMSFSITGSPLR